MRRLFQYHVSFMSAWADGRGWECPNYAIGNGLYFTTEIGAA